MSNTHSGHLPLTGAELDVMAEIIKGSRFDDLAQIFGGGYSLPERTEKIFIEVTKAGMAACEAGSPIETCPYEYGIQTLRRSYWMGGWRAQDRQMRADAALDIDASAPGLR